MARDWRRAVLAAVAAAMLGGACALGASIHKAHAQPAEDEPEEDQAAAKSAESPQPKGKRRQDPAEAQRSVEAALKQLQAGKAEPAIQAASAVLAGGNLPPAIMAKALYVRGAAYRQKGRSAQAISDLNSALWLRGGLGGEDRDEAIRARAAAYADAGLGDPGDSAAPPPKAATSGGGGGNWLSGLFGGSSTPAPPPAPARPPPPPPPQVSAAPVEREPAPAPQSSPKAAAADGGWAPSKTQARPSPRPAATAAAPPPAPRQRVDEAAAPRADGHFLIQLGAVRTEAEAKALAAKAKREHTAVLGSRGQSIDRAVLGNMGAFYMVRFGPFASAQETQAACARIQGSGIDCVPISR